MYAGMGDERNTKALLCQSGHGQADSVDGNGAFFHDQVQDVRRGFHGEPYRIFLPAHGADGSGPVNMPGNDMPAESSVRGQCTFQIDAAACAERSQVGPAQGFRHHVGNKTVRQELCGGQAYAVDCNRVSRPGIFQDRIGLDGDLAGGTAGNHMAYPADLFYDSCKHLKYLINLIRIQLLVNKFAQSVF